MLVKVAVALLLVLSVLEQVVRSDNTDINNQHEIPPEKPASQKGRLSLQNTGKCQEWRL